MFFIFFVRTMNCTDVCKISHLSCFVYITFAIMCRVSLYKALVSIYITGFVMINPVFDDLLIINKAATKINNVCISCWWEGSKVNVFAPNLRKEAYPKQMTLSENKY